MFLYSTVSTLKPAGGNATTKQSEETLNNPAPPETFRLKHLHTDLLFIFSKVIEKRTTDSGDGGDNFSQLEFVEDGGFPCSIKAHHEDPHLFLPKEVLKQACKHVPHLG